MVHLNTFLPDYFIYENPQRKNLDCVILLQRLHRKSKYLLQSLTLTDRKLKQRFCCEYEHLKLKRSQKDKGIGQ